MPAPIAHRKQKKQQRPSAPKPRKPPAPRLLTAVQVAAAVRTLREPSGTARFGAGKSLMATAERDPARVYPHFDDIAAQLTSASKIVCWNAMRTLGCLAAVDEERKLDGALDRILAFIGGGNLISASNAVAAAASAARSRPELLDRVVPAILDVRSATYETPECRNVAIGNVLRALEGLWAQVGTRPDVLAFVRGQRSNSRAAVARHARKLVGDL